mmetsp:Transcript_35619/g.45728  ORF Transcript_35619/g.45728 Transcript_35619/m.45728 type:complete len:314 (-) Transcript_35619:131-1072(-)
MDEEKCGDFADLCKFPICTEANPMFNSVGSDVGKFCYKHRLPGMINVSNPGFFKASKEDVDEAAHYAELAQSYEYHFKRPCHKNDNPVKEMSDMKRKPSKTRAQCLYTQCTKQPFYNYKGEHEGSFCVNHKLIGMVNVTFKRSECEFPGCENRPHFNVPGEEVAKFCSKHKLEGIVGVGTRKCLQINCQKYPTFNYEGQNRAAYCTEHKLPGMVDVKNLKCEQSGCRKRPLFNFEEEPNKKKKGRFCSEHKLDGMVDVYHKRCEHPGCYKICPKFNFESEVKGKYCVRHKSDGMIDIQKQNKKKKKAHQNDKT